MQQRLFMISCTCGPRLRVLHVDIKGDDPRVRTEYVYIIVHGTHTCTDGISYVRSSDTLCYGIWCTCSAHAASHGSAAHMQRTGHASSQTRVTAGGHAGSNVNTRLTCVEAKPKESSGAHTQNTYQMHNVAFSG